MKKAGFTTRLLHTPYNKDDVHGALQVPIYAASAFDFDNSEDIEGAFKGTKPAHAYSRTSNPTVEYLEMRIKSITEGIAVVACASGMAAISNTIMALCNAGDNIITTRNLFGNTFSLFESTIKSFGIEARYANFSDLKSIQPLIDSNTRLIFLETISNPQLEVADINTLSAIAKKNNLVLVVDTTMSPPCFFDAKAFGIDLCVMSSTKYISTGASTIGGIIVDNGLFDWSKNPKLASWHGKYGNLAFFSKLKKEIFRNTGGCLSPFNAYLQVIGLETMQLRVERASKNALVIAQWLENKKEIKRVNYTGLKSSPYYKISLKQFGTFPGSLLTFDLESAETCYRFMDKLKIIRRATNLSDNKTLIIHPASTIYSEFDSKTQQTFGIRDTMMRLSVGIEETDDLLSDIENALKNI
jgi:O-acetylhomoserine (thiol)-lyase